jgi:hypothetical protein
MTFIRGWLVVVMATGYIFTPQPIAADVGPLLMFRGGGVIAPLSPHPSIRLDSQEVIIRLKPGSYVVDVVFNLFNTGETATESVGFPKWVASQVDFFPTFMRFEGSVNGRQLQFNEERDRSTGAGIKYNVPLTQKLTKMKEKRGWLVSQVTFAGHEGTTIHVTYEARYYSQGYHEASYTYGTGSLWKDNIGKAVFIVDSTEVGGQRKSRPILKRDLSQRTPRKM